ncbi:hypothetical protein EDC04DRAFT_380296 [Pisolithus marmoratus]|nr:hypothetical protein EDC04DRAFT_380296 [Pisolithus marmoratus]
MVALGMDLVSALGLVQEDASMRHHPRSSPRPHADLSESPPSREAAFSSRCPWCEGFVQSSVSPPRSLCSNAPPRRFPPSSEPSPRRRFSFCFFCGQEGHIRAQCKICTSHLAAGKCRIIGGHVVLLTGTEIPREALGRTLQDRLDSWALARTQGASETKVQPPLQVPFQFSPQPPLEPFPRLLKGAFRVSRIHDSCSACASII